MTLAAALTEKPVWRGGQAPGFVEAQLRFNQWFKSYRARPPIFLVDTRHASEDEVTVPVIDWLNDRLRA